MVYIPQERLHTLVCIAQTALKHDSEHRSYGRTRACLDMLATILAPENTQVQKVASAAPAAFDVARELARDTVTLPGDQIEPAAAPVPELSDDPDAALVAQQQEEPTPADVVIPISPEPAPPAPAAPDHFSDAREMVAAPTKFYSDSREVAREIGCSLDDAANWAAEWRDIQKKAGANGAAQGA